MEEEKHYVLKLLQEENFRKLDENTKKIRESETHEEAIAVMSNTKKLLTIKFFLASELKKSPLSSGEKKSLPIFTRLSKKPEDVNIRSINVTHEELLKMLDEDSSEEDKYSSGK